MHDKKDTSIVVSIIIVIVVVVGIIAYAMTRTPATPTDTSSTPSVTTPSQDQSQATTGSTATASDTSGATASASLPGTSASNSTSSMQSNDPLAAGQAFLAENAKKSGVVTLPDGLQYSIITEGTGPKPTTSQTVTVNYEGKLIDGTIFDSSYQRGEPISFGVTQVIPGWTEALQLMPVGSTWMLYIPSNLAYGAQGAGSAIGPNETLIFKVQLISAQ